MTTQAEKRKSNQMGQVLSLARKKLGRSRASDATVFIRGFYADTPPDDILGAAPDDLYGAALSCWEFGHERPRAVAKVRVFNPERDQHGWSSRHTIVEIINDDMPFLVDSVAAELNRRDLTVHLMIHPVIRLHRDGRGRLQALADDAKETGGKHKKITAESFMHVEIDAQSSVDFMAEIALGLERVLADVRAAVDDWRPILAKLAQVAGEIEKQSAVASSEEVAETREFLKWLEHDHFTFLGYRQYKIRGRGADARMTVEPDSGLGILRDPELHVFEGVRSLSDLPPAVRKYLRRKQLLIVNKANLSSTVHRAGSLDAIGIKLFDSAGKVVGERIFVGMFTSTVYNRSPRYIPFLKGKIAKTIARAGFEPASHNGKALLHILETFPRDELFHISEDDLFKITHGILHLQERQQVRLFVRHDAFERFASSLVYVPRESYSTEMRGRLEKVLQETFAGPTISASTQLSDDSVLARVHIIIKTTPGAVPNYEHSDVEARLVEASRSWSDHLRDEVTARHGEEQGVALWRRFADAFPTSYHERFTPAASVDDIVHIDDCLGTSVPGLNLYRPDGSSDVEVRFKIYHCDTPVALSDVLPMLENMGFRVIDEVPYEVKPKAPDGASRAVWIHDFGLVRRADSPGDAMAVRSQFQDAFASVWTGEMENDGFNRLVVGAGLDWRQVTVLRAYGKYLLQAAIPFSQAYMEQTLVGNSKLTRLIATLFATRFDPAARDGAKAVEKKLAKSIEAALDAVVNLDEDRILRRFANLVGATLRTNFYQTGSDGAAKPYLSLKLNSREIDGLPEPRPWVEIFVCSPRTEGIHLRGGQVARGGIRWSDRREDFRTEILGLMKAQMTKNAVIVPVGAKGGFVVKRPPPPTGDAAADREAMANEVVECYRTLIRGLLDLTDNLQGDEVVPPPQVVRRDGDDSYLVVAADRGTATFSDIANEISAEYGFWLADAFASGGSAGYDHKIMGITARGAWEAVKRHFRELGRDIQKKPFTVVGVGDMSGDVFGNAMLLSPHIRLVAAFNHQHIFIDPKPAAAASFTERKRLFRLKRSVWSDYARKHISRGGGVFDRAAKSIPVSEEMKKLFDLTHDSATPAALIRAILTADVDLLWFGGIGTFVKASDERNTDVGDRANDSVRVEGGALRAKVIGEGANLGITQRGRIEFALKGGRINTDAIDNSGGVDTSDREVNIKILLNELVAGGAMSLRQRNTLLAKMTNDLAELVLRDNYQQTRAISLVAHQGTQILDQQVRLMRTLEREGKLDPVIEDLPNDETLAERKAAGRALTRPEISVLMSYAKIDLYEQLLESDLPDDRFLDAELLLDFPPQLGQKYEEAICRHRLRREIITTRITNDLINQVGGTFVRDEQERSGLSAADVARAYIITRDSFGLRSLWQAVDALDNVVPARVQAEIMLEAKRLLERGTLWLLRNGRQPLDMAGYVERFRPCVGALSRALDDQLSTEDIAAVTARRGEFERDGVPTELATRVAGLDVLGAAFDIVRLTGGHAGDVIPVAKIYFSVGARFGMDWLRLAARRLTVDDHWDKLALAALLDDLYDHQYALTLKVLDTAGRATMAEGVVEAWIDARAHLARRVRQIVDDVRAAGAPDLAKLSVVNRQLGDLAAS